MFDHDVVPRVSVLMPTFKQATFIRRALESLKAQTFTAWELIVVDDGSPDTTAEVVHPYLADPRLHYHRLPRNLGLGAALNTATALARGQYLAYLPSDDLYYPDHLARLVSLLDHEEAVYLAYGGLRWRAHTESATLQGDAAVGHEAELLFNPPPVRHDAPLTDGNLLALVQVLHRRGLEPHVQWTPRTERVSDELEPDFWRALLHHGARFAYGGEISCVWVDHQDQRHKLLAGVGGGLSRYRAYFNIEPGHWLNWQPSRGICVNEWQRYGRFAVPRALPSTGGLKILLAGELGFNPDRIMAFEEAGHKLYSLWITHTEGWDNTGPFPFGNIENIPYAPGWLERVRQARPDIIYGLLNIHVLQLLCELLDASLDIPFVFHFKEGPFMALERGQWPQLMHLLHKTDGQVYINRETFEWYQLATDHSLDPARSFILDGDLPKADWHTDDWVPKLSAQDGAIHTVCPGRPLGLDPFEGIAAAGMHVHFYGKHFQQWFPNWTRNGLASGYMHLHATVEPADWVRELSQYDAAWHHIFTSTNGGDLRRASWDDLNLPARLGTYAAAGLPWIMKDNRGSHVALQRIAQAHDVGIFFNDFEDLAAQLHDRDRLVTLTTNMRTARHLFAFDTYLPELVHFFRQSIAYHWNGSAHR
ncbi:MAG: glycosyltransferase family 2 protein [Herpetosiphonaceae bacterium]|nr:glycosyltransferase family 2 protein [Herpetosiphonaceae bacterium]